MLAVLIEELKDREDHDMICVGDIKRMLTYECDYCEHKTESGCSKWGCQFEPKRKVSE